MWGGSDLDKGDEWQDSHCAREDGMPIRAPDDCPDKESWERGWEALDYKLGGGWVSFGARKVVTIHGQRQVLTFAQAADIKRKISATR